MDGPGGRSIRSDLQAWRREFRSFECLVQETAMSIIKPPANLALNEEAA